MKLTKQNFKSIGSLKFVAIVVCLMVGLNATAAQSGNGPEGEGQTKGDVWTTVNGGSDVVHHGPKTAGEGGGWGFEDRTSRILLFMIGELEGKCSEIKSKESLQISVSIFASLAVALRSDEEILDLQELPDVVVGTIAKALKTTDLDSVKNSYQSCLTALQQELRK